ncbi:class A beta-lactamase-related serine hydrolase [Nocardioides marmoriginsengisoli]|uniref:Class A beta-lactamase-related serine hydrolase n=2 Tax=Nocardioides marmoriginsengisoli TaxID=661483 RepID=A0A3N0CA79_9ACTN|nr:class A beta-lactamase-related serine hydrolase [Nocardioides marmoriginsengisoli]
MSIEGTCADGFEPLRDLLETNLANGEDAGASIAVVRDGELVVDLWGGEARPGVAWARDTITQVWSVTKAMGALTVLTQVEKGLIDLDAPVTEYWPAYGAQGKENVLVRHLLGHTSGVPGWTPPIRIDEILDLEYSEGVLADETPWYEPGSAPAYQLVCHGHLLDAVVRGAVGRPLADVLHDQVMAPLGGGFRLGVPDEELDRCADLIAPPPSGLDFGAMGPDHFLIRTILNPLLSIDACNGAAWRQGAVGGAGGHGNARGIARAQALISHGGEVDGVRLLSEETIDRIFEVQSEGDDLLLGVPVRFGMGYALPMSSAPAIPEGRVCWWTGYGGAIVVNDLDTRTTFAYAPNKLADHMVASPRTDGYVRAAFAAVRG